MLVSLMVDEFLAERSVKLGRCARDQYARELTRFLGWLEQQNVTDTSSLTLPVLVGYMTWLREVPTPRGLRASKTVVTYYKTLKCLLRWAVDAEYLGNRVLKLPAPRLERKIPETIRHQDAKSLVKAARTSHGGVMQARDTAITLLLLDTGLRASEMCSLAVEDVNLDEGYVLVKHGKGSKWRQVGPLSERTIRALRTYRNQWRSKQPASKTCDAFFLSRKHGPLGRCSLGEVTSRLKERAGVECKANPHSFRHSYARSQAEAGADVLSISRLLGHSSLLVTQTYLASFSSIDARKHVGSVVDAL